MRRMSTYALAAAAAMVFGSVASAATATFVNPAASGGFGYTNLGTGTGASPTNYTASGDGSGTSVQDIANGWAGLLSSNLTFTRIFDSGPSPSTYNDINSAAVSTAIDSLWKDGIASVSLRATYAGDNQWVGTRTASGLTTQVEPDAIPGTQLSANGKFINVKAGFTSIAASNPFPFLLDTGLPSPSGPQTFEFVRSGDGVNVAQSSDPSANNPQRDQMISFIVTGDGFQPGEFYYAIFFEDRSSGDFDFNDMALLFRGTAAGPVIPLPAASLMGLTLMGGLGLTRPRRHMA